MIHPFNIESKMHKCLERRGYERLEDLLAETHPRVRAEWFPPYREIFLPRECELLVISDDTYD